MACAIGQRDACSVQQQRDTLSAVIGHANVRARRTDQIDIQGRYGIDKALSQRWHIRTHKVGC